MPSDPHEQEGDATAAAPEPVQAPEADTLLLARIAKEWLTFERLRQELLNLGASDPVLVSGTDRDVEKAVTALLAPSRDQKEREIARYALMHALTAHPEIIRLRFEADKGEAAVAPSALQALLLARDDVFAKWSEFQDGMQRVGATICRICINEKVSGTGFLISDRHVLTAHHCIKDLVDEQGQITGSDLALTVVFDDIADPGKSSGAFRTVFHAAKNWLLFDSKFDIREDRVPSPPNEVDENCLDFAVISLRELAGRTAPKQHKSTPRKWIDIRHLADPPKPQTQMLIAHHPGGADLRLSVGLFGTHASLSRRVRYLTPTILGSSGAPCFNINWVPYALHNAGYPAVPINQGVPLSLIVAAMGGLDALDAVQTDEARLLPVVLSNGEPILGREQIARHVDAILKGTSSEVALIVTSAPQGGKTFTAELMRSMVIDRGHSAFLLDAEMFSADAPEAFARRLVNQIAGGDGGIPQPPSPDSRQRARWISRSLSEWTRSRVAQERATDEPASTHEKKTLWLILDRCDVVRFTQETHDLLVALIADDALDLDQPLRFLLLGYEGDLGALPPERIWKEKLDLISVSGVLPYMRHVLASLFVVEEPEATRKSAENWIGAVKDVGIADIPRLILGLMEWEKGRRKKSEETEGGQP